MAFVCWWTGYGREGWRDEVKIDLWFKDVAPSAGLRLWFGHAPARWPGF